METNQDKYRIKKAELCEKFRILLKSNVKQVGLVPKNSTHLARSYYKKTILDLRHFDQVISVDERQAEVTVEGSAKFSNIVKATLKNNLIPKVVPEFKNITIGGAISGLGLESSSFKYGIVQETINNIELLTGNGEVIQCSKEINSDIFNALPNSFGTLGYVLKCTLSLIPSKKFVLVSVVKFDNAKDYFNQMTVEVEKATVNFVDGVVFNYNNLVLVLGTMVDTVPTTGKIIDPISRVYYDYLNQTDESVFYMTLEDYLFRYDPDAFWGTGSKPILKKIFGVKLLRKTVLKNLLTASKLRKGKDLYDFLKRLKPGFLGQTEELIQDVGVKIEQAEELLRWYDQTIGLYPVWICPLKKMVVQGKYPLFDFQGDMIVDFGFYGYKRQNGAKDFYLKTVEKKIGEMGGMKGLYSVNAYSNEEFWQIYNKREYSRVKQITDPDNLFPMLDEKVGIGKI